MPFQGAEKISAVGIIRNHPTPSTRMSKLAQDPQRIDRVTTRKATLPERPYLFVLPRIDVDQVDDVERRRTNGKDLHVTRVKFRYAFMLGTPEGT